MENAKRPFLSGERVFLRGVEPEDYPTIKPWLNDPLVTHFMFYGQTPMNAEQTEKMLSEQANSPHDIVFMVCDKATGKAIGFAGLYEIHPRAQKAEFRVLIGETDFWGKGLGTEVTEMLTFYGFDRLNLHRIYLGVTSENLGALRVYEKAGYAHEGVLRDDIYRNSRFYDSVRMGILRDEYYSKFFETHKQRFA